MLRILFFLESAFSLWMLVDAARRSASFYWYPVIMMPFGECVYFFVVKAQDPEFDWARELYKKVTTKKVTLDQLRYRMEQSPTFASKLELAQALYDRKSYREAAGLFAEAVAMHDDSREALYGLALAQIGADDPEPAIANLQLVIELDPAFRDYAAFPELAQTLTACGRADEALELLDQLVVKNPRLSHRVLYAHYLLHSDRRDEARDQLRVGLEEHDFAPKYLRRKNRAWAQRAKKMLKQETDSWAIGTREPSS